MSFRNASSRVALAVALCCVVVHDRSESAEEVLKNEDVVKMVSAGLGEDTIVAKVREAPQVAFQLSVDDLLALRKAGVSERVVQAMLERSKRAAEPPRRWPAEDTGLCSDVSLKTASGTMSLSMVKGNPAVGGGMAVFMNFQGLRSAVRTHDRRPVLLVTRSLAPEVGHYFIARLDVDERNNVRSLKVGSTTGHLRHMFGGKRPPGGTNGPDPDWVLPYEVAQESPGIWRITVTSDLRPGEYGWYVNFTGPEFFAAIEKPDRQGGGLFEFGVD